MKLTQVSTAAAAAVFSTAVSAFAIHPNVGQNLDDFTVLAGGNVLVTATGTALVNGAGAGGVPGSPGRTGAGTSISGGTVTSNPGGNITGGLATTGAAELATLKSGLSALTPDFTFAGIHDLRTLDIDSGGPIPPGTLVPGVYSFGSVIISDSGASPDVTFDGAGEYIINITGSFSTADNVQIALMNGANAADIFWNVGSLAVLGDISSLAGIFLAESSALIGDSATLNGKLMARTSDLILIDNGSAPRPTVNDSGFPPNVLINGSPVPQNGTQLAVCVGGTLNYTVSATDPEGQLTSLMRTDVDPAGAAASFTSPASGNGTPTATLNEVFAPNVMLANTTVTVSYRATDASGAVTDFEADIVVEPDLSSISGLVFNDLNDNGMRDPGEPPLAGALVTLDAGADDTIDDSVTTGPDGTYSFTGLAPGTYVVRQKPPPGFVQTTADPAPFMLAGCDDVADVDFGDFFTKVNAPLMGGHALLALVLLLFATEVGRALLAEKRRES